MSLLKNAIYSIEAGIEDYEEGNDKRNISAVRNVFAGILLLFKEKLIRLSPEHDKELLIRKSIIPVHGENGEIIFIGKGKLTADVGTIKEKFKSLNILVNWERLDEINKLRNEIEHYYTDKSSEKVREILAKSFLIIRDFLDNELDETPASLIDGDYWSILLELEEVYSAEEQACKNSFKNFNWKYETINQAIKHIRCYCCESSLVKLKNHIPFNSEYPLQWHGELTNMLCCSCGEVLDFMDDDIEKCVEAHLGADAYIAAKEGGEPPYDTCPECNKNTFVFDEMCCVICDYTLEHEACRLCNQGLTLEEQELGGLCSYCSHIAEKIRRE